MNAARAEYAALVLTRNVNVVLHTAYRVEDVQAFDDWRVDALGALMEKLAREQT